MLWEDLRVSHSNWGDVSGLFAGELPRLKRLNMNGCKKLKTDSMESIGMKALGTLFHVSFHDVFLYVMLWEELNVRYSNWGDVSGIFAGDWSSLTQLDMAECKNLKTDSMESIGMKALGTLFHVSSDDEFLLCGVMRGSKCSIFQLGGCQWSICGRVTFFEDTGYVWL